MEGESGNPGDTYKHTHTLSHARTHTFSLTLSLLHTHSLTHTIFLQPGINQRALQELFSTIRNRKDTSEYELEASMFEIYNEKVRWDGPEITIMNGI